MSDYSSIIVPFIVLGFIAAAFIVSGRMSKRAVGEVIAIFQKHNAVGIQQAKTVSELGLTAPNLVDSFTRLRDYKPDALNTLMRMDIVQSTEEGKLYISEDKLAQLRSKGMGT